VEIPAGRVSLAGELVTPASSAGVVIFAHGSGSSRRSPRNIQVARVLNQAGLATLLFDLLTPAEGANRAKVFDISLLGARLTAATEWLSGEVDIGSLSLGYFGASTGVAAALWAAAGPRAGIRAIVSRGGRPDLAGPHLAAVTAPTLLIVGGEDVEVLELNRRAQDAMRCLTKLEVIPGATHLFEEPGALERVADLAREWFTRHLGPGA